MMDEQRVEVYFDSLRPDYPEYLNALEKEALRTEVPIIRRAIVCRRHPRSQR